MPVVGWVVPFLKTPINLTTFAARRTPFGFAMKSVWDDLHAGGASRDQALARMTLGTTASMAAVSYGLEGKMTGGGPSDHAERKALMATGWRPYSIKIGDEWHSYNRLDPLGTLMAVSADIAEIIGKAREDGKSLASVKGGMEMVTGLGGGFAKFLLNQPYLSGVSELIKALDDPDRHAKRFLERFATSFIPNAVGQIARADDPIMRETKGLIDKIKASLPGMSKHLYPRRDMWGEPITRDGGVLGGGVAGRLLSPSKSSSDDRDKLTEELIRLDLAFSPPSRTFRNVNLTPEQFDKFSAVRGRILHGVLGSLVASPSFERSSDSVRRALLDVAIREVMTEFSDAFADANPDLVMIGDGVQRYRHRGRRRGSRREPCQSVLSSVRG